MGQIVFNGQKPKYCNLTAITTGSKKDYVIPAGEVWLIDSTNTSKTDGTGKYDKYIIGDSNHTASYLATNVLMNIDNAQQIEIDSAPTSGSVNAVSSGGVYQAIQDIDVSSQISGKADKSEMSVVAGTGANADKTTITLKSGTSATVLTQHQDVSGKEDKSNKVTSFSSPTDTQYPSAKLVSDQLATKQDVINDLADIRANAGKGATAIQSVIVGTTTTGAAGTNASVTNTGTATAPVLNFTIPQGAQGVKGDTVIMGSEATYTLYNTTGDAVDGAMTQQAVTRELAELRGDADDNLFIRVVLDANDRILYGVKKNGDFYFGAGVPSIIQESLIGLDEKLNSEIRTLTSEIGVLTTEKVSKEDGKSLINTDFADGISVVDSSEIVDIKLDGDGRIVELTKKDGTKVFYSGLEVKGNIHSEPVNFELKDDVNFISVKIDAKGQIISAKTKYGDNFPKKKENQFIPQYSKLLDAMRDDCYEPFLLGSQLVQANTSVYDKELGSQNTFNADKLIKQFNYIGLDGKLPNMKMGRLQKIMIGDVQATILYMGTYIYAITDGNGIVYRMPYSKLSIITESNTDIDSISISLDNMIIDGVYETNDGNFLIQVYDGTSPDTYPTRSLYKVTLDGELNATVSDEPVIVCVQGTTNIVGVREHWSFKQYGAMILISPYGAGRTGQLWLSKDYGNSFDCIFNVANDTTYVATKPNGQGGYGAYGIHPLPSQMLPPQGDDFWNNVSNIGNGSKHIHSLCYDEEFERIWLVTGDDKYLATGIYWSDDFGKIWHRKSLVFHYPDIDCGETTQMLQVVSMKNCVLFGTDGWGNGIFRYNRGKKEDEPVLEFVFGWDTNRDNLYGIASHNIVTSDGIMLMVFAANSNAALPRGGVVASDGYHFNKIFIDTYSDGVTLESQKIGWPSFLSVNNDNLYIRTKNKNEIILIEKYNY